MIILIRELLSLSGFIDAAVHDKLDDLFKLSLVVLWSSRLALHFGGHPLRETLFLQNVELLVVSFIQT